MDEKEIKRNRINELRIKAYYTETVRDNYKNIHPGLYQANSYYLERLKQELGELEKSFRDMDDRNQRKFSRVKMQRPVRLDFCSTQYQGVIDDISLCGSFVKGAFKQSKGDICKIDLKDSVSCQEGAVRAIGSIIRCSDSGIAIDFIAMKTESYHWLETELLTRAVDPSVLEDEIFQRSIFEFDDDLVCSSVFNGSRNKLKKLLDLP
ncbi:PilZ domain-containing protein [Candidatus Electrothrix marina]|uniref:PilZ domain-containing protein n=1 Tax=Candidatus Electrothrix marina TaxID=1859130 RepID=A0A3S3U6X1_9BACT|nr:PilZ domain-containing protein [Candidatus Electrothrix marina]RWX52406.1 PilZ domain-containing protein [Candidatus Electrothrix marina]